MDRRPPRHRGAKSGASAGCGPMPTIHFRADQKREGGLPTLTHASADPATLSGPPHRGVQFLQPEPVWTVPPPKFRTSNSKIARFDMAKSGRRQLSAEDKRARGTLRPSRDNQPQGTAGAAAPLALKPVDDLPLGVAVVWEEYAAAAVANGARQCDADAFAEWCTMTDNLRRSRAATGTAAEGLPPASYLAQWRMLGEAFGLAGPRSRVGAALERKDPNPFLAHRPRPPE